MLQTIWIVWAQYHDKSNDPVMLTAFAHEKAAIKMKEMIDKANPSMGVYVTEIQNEDEMYLDELFKKNIK